jgi:hypothetical protein
VRLYDFDTAEAQRLQRAFESLADGSVDRVVLEQVASVDGTEIAFVGADRGRDVVEIAPGRFEVVITPEGWRQVADLTQPFCDGHGGFQWLIPQTSAIELLLSKDGRWQDVV